MRCPSSAMATLSSASWTGSVQLDDQAFGQCPRDTEGHLLARGLVRRGEAVVPVVRGALQDTRHAGPADALLAGLEDLDAVLLEHREDRPVRRHAEGLARVELD